LLGDAIALVDSADNCAQAVRELLSHDGMQRADADGGALQVALTDPPDAFLQIADEALQLKLGDVQLRRL
jgi:glutamate racemase